MKKGFFLCMAVLTVALFMSGCGVSNDQSDTPTDGGIILSVHLANNKPDCQVRLMNIDSRDEIIMTTDVIGNCNFPVENNSRYVIIAEGYGVTDVQIANGSKSVEITESGGIWLSVFDENQHPITGAQIEFFYSKDGIEEFVSIGVTAVDGNAEFWAGGIKPGYYKFVVTHPAYERFETIYDIPAGKLTGIGFSMANKK